MTLSDSQLSSWSEVEDGLGAVVPLDDLAETAEFSPSDARAADLTADKLAMRQAMGYKE